MKDVLSLNEIFWINEVATDLNEWVVEREEGYSDDAGDGLVIKAVLVVVQDSNGKPFGTFTKYTSEESVKFEPDFVPDLVMDE